MGLSLVAAVVNPLRGFTSGVLPLAKLRLFAGRDAGALITQIVPKVTLILFGVMSVICVNL
jgi:hypothetical protein